MHTDAIVENVIGLYSSIEDLWTYNMATSVSDLPAEMQAGYVPNMFTPLEW